MKLSRLWQIVGKLNSSHRQATNRRRVAAARPRRAGSVSLMLVLVLAMLVGAFAVSLSSRAAQQQRVESQHQTIAVLESAIATARQAKLAGGIQLRLPLDEADKEWIIVEQISPPNDAPAQFQATRYRNDRPGTSICRLASIDDKDS